MGPRMRPGARFRATFFALAAILSAAAPAAAADPDPDATAMRLPIPEAQRPITLPRLVGSPGVEFQVDRRPGGASFAELDVSGRFGITDDLTVHALVAPLQLSSPGGGGLQYGENNRNQGPGLGATYRFVRGVAEVGAGLSGYVYTVPGISGGSVTPTVRTRIHATDSLRLDLNPAMTFQLASVSATGASANAVRLDVPLGALVNLTEAFDVGVTTGLTIYDVSDPRGTTGIPLGFALGYVIAGSQGPVVDIDPFFNFPYLVMPGRASPIVTGQYQVGLDLTGFFYL
jgi:hypothetical protein